MKELWFLTYSLIWKIRYINIWQPRRVQSLALLAFPILSIVLSFLFYFISCINLLVLSLKQSLGLKKCDLLYSPIVTYCIFTVKCTVLLVHWSLKVKPVTLAWQECTLTFVLFFLLNLFYLVLHLINQNIFKVKPTVCIFTVPKWKNVFIEISMNPH